MGEFKRFVSHENTEKKKEKIKNIIVNFFKFFIDNVWSIITTILVCVGIFSIFYIFAADGSKSFDTKITKIQKIEKSYVNDADTLYIMNIVSKERNFKEDVKLTKEEYITYSNAYSKGIDTYKYTEYNTLYVLCSCFLGLTALLFIIFGG